MRWILLFLLDIAAALDWYDLRRLPLKVLDHTKVVPDLVIALMTILMTVYTLRTNQLPPVLWPVLVISGAFGQAMWTRFLASKSATVTTTESVTRVEQPVGAPPSILDVGYPPVASTTTKTTTAETPPVPMIPGTTTPERGSPQ